MPKIGSKTKHITKAFCGLERSLWLQAKKTLYSLSLQVLFL